MNRRLPVVRALCVVLLAVIALTAAAGVRADEPSRAGLVVVYAPDDVHTACVTFDAAEVSGLELLRLAGLDVIQEGTAGVGDTVCKIDAVGCDFPGEHCFCQCLGTPCTFWSYWYWQDGDWVFSPRGASLRRVGDGALEAWVWGDGQTPPPAIDLASICSAPAQLSAPASQDGYPAPEPTTDTGGYPGPDDGEEVEPTPEPMPTDDEVLVPTIAPEPEEETPTPEESAEPTETAPSAEATSTPSPAPTATRTRTATPTTAGPTGTPTHTPGPTATPTDDGMAAAIATAVARNRATPPATGGGSRTGSYLAFALLALVLVALIVYAILLRRQRARRALE